MTEHEMLAYAAKADGRILTRAGYLRSGEAVSSNPDYRWDPRHNDADAFRLQVSLALLVHVVAYKPGENAWGFVEIAWHGQREPFKPEKFTDDPCAATRRAIFRAAAEIGRQMP